MPSNRRQATAVVIGLAVAFLTTACGSSGTTSSAAANGSSSADAASGVTPSASTSVPGDSDDILKACTVKTGYDNFFGLQSVEATQGVVTVHVTQDTCKVDESVIEDIEYTPGPAESYTLDSNASIRVFKETSTSSTPETVSSSWLVENKEALATHEFYLDVNAKHQVIAMEEVYQP